MQGFYAQVCRIVLFCYIMEREKTVMERQGNIYLNISHSLWLHTKGPTYHDVQRCIWRTLNP